MNLSYLSPTVTGMDDVDRKVLELAGRFYIGAGGREQAMRDELDMSSTVFWAHANRLVSDPPAGLVVEFAPTIARLRRLRASRQRQRTARRAG